jgi:hypothetical protein
VRCPSERLAKPDCRCAHAGKGRQFADRHADTAKAKKKKSAWADSLLLLEKAGSPLTAGAEKKKRKTAALSLLTLDAQTEPPTLPITRFFAPDKYPVGEVQPYLDGCGAGHVEVSAY